MDMQEIMQQAQQFQGKMSKMQEELAGKTVSSTVGGGMVSATVNGRMEVLSLQIEPDAIDPSDPVMLQDLVVAAINDAMKKSREMAQAEMGKLTGGMGLNIPGMF